jgi:hypothetical protein
MRVIKIVHSLRLQPRNPAKVVRFPSSIQSMMQTTAIGLEVWSVKVQLPAARFEPRAFTATLLRSSWFSYAVD